MIRWGSQAVGNPVRAVVVALALCVGLGWSVGDASAGGKEHGGKGHKNSIPNNFPHPNPGGKGATFSTEGRIRLTSEYFQDQGINGRSCGTCHVPEEAWAITPRTVQRLFHKTDGLHPIFNPLDANHQTAGDFATEAGRRAAYSMLLNHAVFRRGGQVTTVAAREWDLTVVDDPHGFACVNLTAVPTPTCPAGGRLVHWRRAMPTINFPLGSTTINWDGSNSAPSGANTVLGGLENQARRNVNGAQQGPTLDGVTQVPPPGLPAFPTPISSVPALAHYGPIIDDIVDFEFALFTAQLIVPGVGRLDSAGAKGGPEELSTMPAVQGPFNLYDAWEHSGNPRRRQIFRGQQLFNNKLSNPPPPANPGRCSGCHNAQNNGTNVNGTLFNIQTASEAARTPGLTLHTFRNKTTLQEVRLTDAGRGNVSGLWNDLGRFKTPTIRGLAARAPYFHNGIAKTLEDVVRHYETFLFFEFTDQERDDLVAFLNAL
jgi:cytochrome c peroxidase